MNRMPQTGIYAVAVAFFIAGMICLVQLMTVILVALGIDTRLNLATINWVLAGYVVALCLACVGVWLLVRMHPVAVWLMFVMTLILGVQLAAAPAVSPYYSAARLYVHRSLLMLPMIASCVYLLRLRSRASKAS